MFGLACLLFQSQQFAAPERKVYAALPLSVFCSGTFFKGCGAKKPGFPSNAEAKGWDTAGVFMLGRFKGKHVPRGSKLLPAAE